MRVVTYNIRGGRGQDGIRSLERIADVLRQIEADVVCLQEVEQRLPWSGFENQPTRLAHFLGMEVAYKANFQIGLGAFGNAVLTRFPVLSRSNHRLPNARERARILKFPERRGALEVEIETDSGGLTVLCTHWSLDSEDRHESSSLIAERIRALESPVVLAGDLNAPPDSEEIAILRQTGLIDSNPTGEPTFPSDHPKVRIDYVWLSKGIQPRPSWSVQTLASDHLPVIIEW